MAVVRFRAQEGQYTIHLTGPSATVILEPDIPEVWGGKTETVMSREDAEGIIDRAREYGYEVEE